MSPFNADHFDALRLRLGISIKELAERAGLDRSVVKNALDGKPVRPPTAARIEATLHELSEQVGIVALSPPKDVEALVHDVVMTHISDPDLIDALSADLLGALRNADLLRPEVDDE